MSSVFGCHMMDCYNNDNVSNRCLLNEITIDGTGTCENIEICDEYECDNCEHYNLCLKEKKGEAHIREDVDDDMLDGGVITLILYCDNINCDFNDDFNCTNSESVYLDENGTCMSAKYLNNDGVISEEDEDEWIENY